jgi:DNA polymerase
MSVITLDFETYYAKDYGLGKMTTEEYIRDPRFETIGVAVQIDDGEPVWFSGTKEKTKAFLDKFELHNHVVIAHNAMFDMAILNWHFDIRPKRIVDTLSMARALHTIEVGGSLAALVEYYNLGEKGTEVINALGKRRLDFDAESLARYGEYCKNDVALTYKLFGILGRGFPLIEFKLIDLTIRMFTEPKLTLDSTKLLTHLHTVQKRKEDVMNTLDGIWNGAVLNEGGLLTKADIMSNPKFAEVLRRFNVVPPMKISATTGKETYAFSKTDEEFKALLEHPNIHIQILVAARLGIKSTIEETRTERFLEMSQRGTMPVPLRYYAAHTGRWGGDDKVNLQNLPRSSAIKPAILAPAGYKLIDCDSSQIEARTLAWLAEQNDLVEAFDKGEDVYKKMASAIYGKPETDITKDERFVGKTTILGAGYGMGAAKFRAQLKTFGVDMPQEECERIIQVYRATYPRIPELWRQAGRALAAIMVNQTAGLGREGAVLVEGQKGVRLPNGLYIKYPNLRYQTGDSGKEEMVYDTKRGKTTVPNRIYGGKVIENVCQALARIVIGEQMLRINKKYPVVMTVHDAIACLVPDHEVTTGVEFVELCMRLRPEWALELPLNCESGFGKSYGEC